ncbi:hypothetical protein LIER_43146 [Lithospermum erythrorhizon]|uniref:Uncharacterized protein n=1 Tax=Lithospermum erythrorhizon TaxID=34254 RepID=A0AAV3PIQ0_LITER
MAKFLHAVYLRTLRLTPPFLHHSSFFKYTRFSSKASVDEGKIGNNAENEAKVEDDKYPLGEFEFEEFGAWKSFAVKSTMFFA